MDVSIKDLQFAASDLSPPINISSEIGNIIEINDLNDDLGLNLLANQARSKPESAPTFGSAPIRLSVPSEELKPIQFDTLEPIELNGFGSSAQSSSAPAPMSLSDVSVSKEVSPYDNYQSSSAGPSISLTPAPPRDFEKEKQEKIEYLNKLQRLETKGFPISKRFTKSSCSRII